MISKKRRSHPAWKAFFRVSEIKSGPGTVKKAVIKTAFFTVPPLGIEPKFKV